MTSVSTPPPQSRAVRNVFWNWGTYAFAVAVNFFLTPFVVRSLGDTTYGAWVLLASLTGYLSLLDLGVRGAVTRYVSRFHTFSQHEEAGRTASAALLTFSVAGLLAIAISVVVAIFVVPTFKIPTHLLTPARTVVVLGGVTIACSLIGGVFGGILVGLQRFAYTNGIEIGNEGLRVLCIFLALRTGRGIVTLACIQLTFSLTRALTSFLLSRHLYPQLTIRVSTADREHVWMVLSFGIFATLMHVSSEIILYTDSVVIGVFLPVSWITFFGIAANLTNYTRNLISGISQTISPMVSSIEAQGQRSRLEQVLLDGSRFATLVALPILLTFMLRGGTFIGLWIGHQYADLSGQILRILALSLWFAVGNQIIAATMLGTSKHRALVPAYLAEALLNLGLSILLIRRYGIIGVAWGTTIPRLIACVFFGPWFVRHTMGVPIRTYWSTVWGQTALAMVPFALASYGIEKLWPAPNLIVYFAQIAMTFPLALIGSWLLCLTDQERYVYSRWLSRPVRKLLGQP